MPALAWPCYVDMREGALSAGWWHHGVKESEFRSSGAWQNQKPGIQVGEGLVGDMRHFCEGELALILFK